MALTMFNRARWSGKQDAAEVYRRWLLRRLRTTRPRRVEKSENASTA
jgi:hypothetical protein